MREEMNDEQDEVIKKLREGWRRRGAEVITIGEVSCTSLVYCDSSYCKFSNKSTSPNKRTPLFFLTFPGLFFYVFAHN